MPPQRVKNAGCFFASHSVWKVNVFFCLLQHHSGIFLTLFHIVIELFKRLAKDKTDENGNDNIDKESADTFPVIIAVHAANCFAQGIHGIWEWQVAVNHPVNLWQDVNRERTAASGNLDYHENNCKGFTDIAKGNRQCIHKNRKDQAGDRTCKPV